MREDDSHARTNGRSTAARLSRSGAVSLSAALWLGAGAIVCAGCSGGPQGDAGRQDAADGPDAMGARDAMEAMDAIPCPSPGTVCGGICTSLQADPSNCGACGHNCGFAGQCLSGHCMSPCPSTLTSCSSGCVDTQTDRQNCGACNHACMTGYVCDAGACQCPGAVCGGMCADVTQDPHNCGACGVRCDDGIACASSACMCPSGMASCGGPCRDLQTDILHCGACGTACAPGSACVAGACLAPDFRLIAPLSTSLVTSRTPTLHVQLGPAETGAQIQICRDRACASVEQTLTTTGSTVVPVAPLARGVHFWRAMPRDGATGSPSATWEFRVGAASAPRDTSWGTALDVNGDGFSDLAIGGTAEMATVGAVYAYLGGPSGLATAGTTLVTFSGTLAVGATLASAGDVDGDGFTDLLTGDGSGRAAFYRVGADGVAGPGVLLQGRDLAGEPLAAIAAAGDVNADGFGDVAVGVAGLSTVQLHFGTLAGLRSTPDVTLTSPGAANDQFGRSVASGDFNGDGRTDLVVGAPQTSMGIGVAYVYFGTSTGFGTTPSLTLSSPDNTDAGFGTTVASAGDLDGDGMDDIVIDESTLVARTGYVYLGGATIAAWPAHTITWPVGGMAEPFGTMTAAGDVNGDGRGDLLVSARLGGTAFVLLGPTLTTVAQLTVPMDSTAYYFGNPAASAGDLDGDGYDDIVASNVQYSPGRVYVFPGSPTGTTTTAATVLVGTRPSFGSTLFGATN